MQRSVATFDVLSNDLQDQESHHGRSRFGAVVQSLVSLSAPSRAPRIEAAEFDEALPMRRVNRARRLLGKLPKPGKSRNHARRLR